MEHDHRTNHMPATVTTDDQQGRTPQKEVSLVFDRMNQSSESNLRLALGALLGTVPHFDLACIGSSINGFASFTFQMISYLACADIVYYYPPSAQHLQLVKLLNSNVVDMHDGLYSRGNAFEISYDAIVKTVMQAVRSGKKVVYATQGSPAFHCGTAAALYRRAKKEGFSSVLVSGVSSFELLSTELIEEYDIRDVQILSVLSLVENSIRINSRVSALLFDLSRHVLPSIRQPATALSPSKLTTFADILRSTYPRTHEVVLMHMKCNGKCSKSKTRLVDLEDSIMNFGAVPTIFVPAYRETQSQFR
jgi:precorrin-2 methylase